MQSKSSDMFQKEFSAGFNNNTFTNLMSSNVQNSSPFIESNDGIAFTPTTLATLESTLSNLNEDIATSFGTAYTTQQYVSESRDRWTDPADYTGDDDNDDDDSEESSNSAAEWVQVKSEIPSCVPMMTDGSGVSDLKPARKLPGPRPARSIDSMTPVEAERRRRRRERNKTAAARCRQRRVELTNELLSETETLERETTNLQREIDKLTRQKSQLEYVLEAHKPTCRVGGIILPVIKQETPEAMMTGNLSSTFSQSTPSCANRPNTLTIPTSAGAKMQQVKNPVAGTMNSCEASTSEWTPVFLSGDLASPSSYLLLSPTTLLGK